MIKHRFQAQALVKFSLVIVLLLVLIFGILEVGRLLFIYAAVVTSSREAVRYGSVAGTNEAGNLYYQDCDGIRNTARKLAFFQDLQDDEILIVYEEFVYDPGTGGYLPPAEFDVCDDTTDGVSDGVDTDVQLTFDPEDPNSRPNRIKVTVNASFNLIVPIIPIGDSNGSMAIDSTSARTITGIIKLE